MIVAGRTLAPAMALFRSLGDPARLAIARRLAEGEARVVDLTRGLGLAQSTVGREVVTSPRLSVDRRAVLRRRIRWLVAATITFTSSRRSSRSPGAPPAGSRHSR